jgi:hypothetical protein
MVATRKIDWYSVMGSEPVPVANGFEDTRS